MGAPLRGHEKENGNHERAKGPRVVLRALANARVIAPRIGGRRHARIRRKKRANAACKNGHKSASRFRLKDRGRLTRGVRQLTHGTFKGRRKAGRNLSNREWLTRYRVKKFRGKSFETGTRIFANHPPA